MKFWNEAGQCSSCRYCAMDMDLDPYCIHPSVKVLHQHGLNLTKAISEFCGGEELKLREARDEQRMDDGGRDG